MITPKLQIEQIVEPCSYHLEKAACMFTEVHYTMFDYVICCLCVHVPVASGIQNAAIDAAAGTSKHAHSPQPAGI